MDKKRAREVATVILGEQLGSQVVDIRVDPPTADDQKPFDGTGLRVGDKITFTLGSGIE